MPDKDEYWMRKVVDMAEKADEEGEVPIAAVLVNDSEELSRSYSVVSGSHAQVGECNSAVAHAELLTMLKVEDPKSVEGEKILYTNLEPCVMCLSATINCEVDRIVYSLSAPDGGIERNVFTDEIEVPESRSGILEQETKDIFQAFLKQNPDHFGSSYIEIVLDHN